MEHTLESVLRFLDDLADPKMQAINERHGDSHRVNLSKLRALAKDIGKQQELATKLWDSQHADGRLLSLLICSPTTFSVDELQTMVYFAREPKVQDWFVNYVVKKSRYKKDLRLLWLSNADPLIQSAGWMLTTEAVVKDSVRLDLSSLLDTIEAKMKQAPARLQWTMNETLAHIGIYHPQLRDRALEIGYHLEVLKDYPTPPGCTSPFAPEWIMELVKRRES